MKKALLVVAVAATLSALSPLAMAQNLAVVNGKPVPKARMDALMQQMARSGRPISPDQENQVKEEVIAREIFMQEAQKRGFDATEDFKTQMELARQAILIRELFTDFQKKNPVTDEEIKAEYDKYAATAGGKEYKVRHILVEKEDQAKALIAQIKKGGKFEELAKKNSKDPGSGANGGDLDWANPSSFVKEFSEAMTKLAKGQMTQEAVKSQFGWHIIRVDDVREAKLPSMDEIKPQISQQLLRQKMEKYQQELRAGSKIE